MGNDGFWVFGYGSLIWRPGFDHEQRVLARLDGFSRSFCMTSIHYRGTQAQPGLVLALDPAQGAQVEGVAYFVPPDTAKATLAYLRERELVSYAYYESIQPLTLQDGRVVKALCYVVDRDHAQYAGGLGLPEQARMIATAQGSAGPNRDYLFETLRHLIELGIDPGELAELAALVRADGSGAR